MSIAALLLFLPACAKQLASNTLVVEQPEMAGTMGPAVDVVNFRGSVEVRVKPWLKTISFSYEVTAGSETEDVDAARAAVHVHGEMDTTGEFPVFVVRSTSTMESSDMSARLRVDLPACSGVRVINQGGEVIVHGTSGAVQVENAGGAVEVKTSHALTAPVALSTTDASIYLRAPTTSMALVDAETQGGEVIWEALHSSTRVTGFRASAGKLGATVNAGENAVLLRTSEGDIHVSFLADPVARVVHFK